MINLSNTNVIITGSTGEIGGSIVKKLYQKMQIFLQRVQT